jgi:peptidoglycan hydrolase-like protein with peptidoglycan-binding domain
MSTAAVTNLPFQTGGAVAAAAGRGILLVVGLYMRQPLRNTVVAGMIGLSCLAGSNALYFQAHRHPSPLFGVTDQRVAVAEIEQPRAIKPATRPKTKKLPAPDTTTTGSVTNEVTLAAIGNSEVFDVQRKLEGLKLFDGKVDGFYGPRTARAIKDFEASRGLKQKGELTREIVDLILTTSITAPAPKIETPKAATLATLDAPPIAIAETVQSNPAQDLLPDPEPLAATVAEVPAVISTPAPVTPKQVVLGRDLPDTPQEALNLAAETAGDAIDTIVDGVQNMSMTKVPAAVVPKRVVQTIAVKANTLTATRQPLPAVLPPANVVTASTDNDTVSKVQRGLASLGFLHGTIDGVAGEATAKAIRNFEVYYNYNVTGRISPELVNLLVQNGAVI